MLVQTEINPHDLSWLTEGPTSDEGGGVDESGWDEGGWDEDGWGEDG